MIFAIILIGATNLATDYTRGALIRRHIGLWHAVVAEPPQRRAAWPLKADPSSLK